MNKIEKLSSILKKLNAGEDLENTRKEALELVQGIDALELSLAEQKLIEDGLKPEDLRNLCTIHMEVLQDEMEKLRAAVEPGHVLHTMMIEHDEILKFLDQLEVVNQKLQSIDLYDKHLEEFKLLTQLAESLLGAEAHHQREEQVLFLEMEDRKITGPTRIMRMEHDDLRMRKHKILALGEQVATMDYGVFKTELKEAAEYIIFHLRDHIFKENHILYPTAFDAIQEQDVWKHMKERCDDIGYCIFTPETEK